MKLIRIVVQIAIHVYTVQDQYVNNAVLLHCISGIARFWSANIITMVHNVVLLQLNNQCYHDIANVYLNLELLKIKDYGLCLEKITCTCKEVTVQKLKILYCLIKFMYMYLQLYTCILSSNNRRFFTIIILLLINTHTHTQ